MQAGGGGVRYSPQPNPPDRLAGLFGGNPDPSFALQGTACGTGRRAANKSFVHFDGAKKTLSSGTNHRPAQLVEPTPSRFITSQPQDSLHPQGAGSRLLAGDQPGGSKPNPQGPVSPLKEQTSLKPRIGF